MDAANQLGSDVKATMAAAQRLFEGDFEGAVGGSGQSIPSVAVRVKTCLACIWKNQSIDFMRKVITLFNAAEQQSLRHQMLAQVLALGPGTLSRH